MTTKSNIKKFLLIITMLIGILLFCNIIANAEMHSGTCGTNIAWSLDTETGVLIISGTGAMPDDNSINSSPWYSFKDDIKTVVIEDDITFISEHAFYDCINLTSVIIPESVTSIGVNAFANCTSLTDVYAESIYDWCNIKFSNLYANPLYLGKYLYINNEQVSGIEIPDTITTIGDYQFFGYENLTSVTIPESVTAIGSAAFGECTGLINVTIPENVETIGSHAFELCTELKNVIISNGVASIDSNAFYGCANLTDIIIPDSVTFIGSYAFYDCTALTSVTLSKNITFINKYIFYNCSSLTSITLPNGATSISSFAFYGCKNLTSITLPSSILKIWNDAFQACYNLTDVYYHGTKEKWEKITIEYNNSKLVNANKHFIEPEITNFSVTNWTNTLVLIEFSTVNLPENYVMYVAGYDDNNRFVQLKEISAEDIIKGRSGMNITTETNFKAFIWDSLNTMTPLCEAIDDKI